MLQEENGKMNGRGLSSVNEAMEMAIGAIDRGEASKAKQALGWVLQRDPNNGLAWIWMAACVDDENAKQECYRRANF
jgi:Tfp pilus assembly protein PilF